MDVPSLICSWLLADIIERLKNDNKYLEALSFACEFNLMERFPPAPLIKLHIKEANKAVKNLSKSGTSSLAVKNEALQKELGALKAVASVVSEYKLENHYTLDYVNKRLETLEKTKAERKRAANASKSLQTSKRLRAGDSSPPGNRSGSPSPKKLLQGVHDREIYDVTHIPPYPGSSIPDLNPRPIGEYDRRPLGEYERRGVGDLERRQIEDIERRRLGLSNPAFAAAAAASSHPPHIPSNYGFPPLSLPSLGGFRSSVPNGQPGYGYSGWPSLGLGGFKPFL
ncbi:hypothetical protein KP509_1Z177200 [Ceratopteris richardii]|nr:hypothetical protein KP509_1Z177200 [Ceratopteris richardii]